MLVHGWLSATLDLLFHACLLVLSHSGRHGHTTAVCACRSCYYGVVAALLLVVVLLLLLPLCAKTEETYTYRKREHGSTKKVQRAKKSWKGSTSNRRRR